MFVCKKLVIIFSVLLCFGPMAIAQTPSNQLDIFVFAS
jgi:hypothetical protein